MVKKSIYALGVGHNTPVMIDLADACGYSVEGLFHFDDSRTGEKDHGVLILGSFDDLWRKYNLKGMRFILTMGDLKTRAELAKKIIRFGGELPSLIHPLTCISTFASISSIGVCVLPFSSIQSDVIIGDNVLILSHVTISHNSIIKENCFLADKVLIGAYTTIEENVFVGQGALIISSKVKEIGRDSYIGAGALLTKPVAPSSLMVGSPARKVRENK